MDSPIALSTSATIISYVESGLLLVFMLMKTFRATVLSV